MTGTSSRYFEFELHNIGAGSEALSSGDLAADYDYVLAVLLRNHYCPECRELVRDLADRHEAFAARGVAVVPVLPDVRERALMWHRRYDLPFPMLADPTGEPEGEPPEEFDSFGPIQRDVAGRPGIALFESEDGKLRLVGSDGGAVPTVDQLLDRVERHGDERRDRALTDGGRD